MSLFFAFALQLALQYTPRLSGIMANELTFILFFIFSYHLSASPLDIYDVTEEEKIIKLIKGLFNKGSQYSNNSINNEAQYNILDEFNDESTENDVVVKEDIQNKYCNKKVISVYLLIFYVLFFLVILLILFLKPFPYSKSYTIIGTFLNIYKDYQNSTMVFLPKNGYNYARKYIKKSGFNLLMRIIPKLKKIW